MLMVLEFFNINDPRDMSKTDSENGGIDIAQDVKLTVEQAFHADLKLQRLVA